MIHSRILFLLFFAIFASLPLSARTLRVLAIGNSFSRDAIEQHLHELAMADGDTMIVGNMYIGGCSLQRHVDNARADKPDYVYRKVGADGKRVETKGMTLARALADEPWDYVSMQQASPMSGQVSTWSEWFPELQEYVKARVPKKTKLMLHQTWAYAKDSGHSGFRNYGCDQDSMYRSIVNAVDKSARQRKIKYVMPAGTAIQNARTTFAGDHLNRDGYHLDLGFGRFTAACAWYGALTGRDVTANTYMPAGMNTDLVAVAKAAGEAAAKRPSQVTDLSAMRPATVLYKDPSVPMEIRIDDLLSRMTTEEKVMQLNQYTLGRNNNENNVGKVVGQLPAELGSVIYFGDDAVLRNAFQRRCMEESRLGIPCIFGYDMIHGYRTIYPISLAQACSWNVPLVERMTSYAAAEGRMTGVDWTFSPMIDVAHDPRWGRVSEGYGEDPYANAAFGAATVRGYQGKSLADSTTIAACLKHFVGYGASEAGRDYVYTEISPQTLWDTYLPPYKACVDAGAVTLMSSFNDISGIPGSANHYTMTEILRNRWKHKGFVVSDWGAIEQLVNQGNAANKKEAGMHSFNAGLDMDMMNHAYDKYLAELIDEGKVDPAQLDESVRRVLRVKMQLGLFENPYTPEFPGRYNRPGAMATAKQLAAESMVLLKNDSTNLLPLSGAKRIAVVGPLSKSSASLLGSWCGRGRFDEVVTVLQGITDRFAPGAEIRCAEGCNFDKITPEQLAQAVDTARWADVVILCLGEQQRWSGENASRSTIALPDVQLQLAREIAATGKPVVMLLSSGRPLDISQMEPLANAILEIWQPGTTGGTAVAEILAGDVNPSGKLAMTFPRSTGQIPIYYNRRGAARRHQGFYQDIPSTPLYPFGHGLSYTTFTYGEPTVSATTFRKGDKVTVSVPVTNTGARTGAETVMWFTADPAASITRPLMELKHFEKRELKPGETATFTFTIDPMKHLSFPDSDGNRILEPGDFKVMVGPHTVNLVME